MKVYETSKCIFTIYMSLTDFSLCICFIIIFIIFLTADAYFFLRVDQKTETINHAYETHEETVSPVSESRSLHSSSADLADVSSISVTSSSGLSNRLPSANVAASVGLSTPTAMVMSAGTLGAVDGVVADSLGGRYS
jgi:hypothetical protein